MNSFLDENAQRERKLAAWLAVIFGTILLVVKFIAYNLTHSQAIYSDALESTVNVVAAAVGVVVIAISAKPADQDHPYGHGKIEYFSAAFEGGLIVFAALAILINVVDTFIRGTELREINAGVVLTGFAGVANAGIGIFLKRRGTQYNSLALVASGEHLLSDFWTSMGVVVGLLLIQVTGVVWFDPVLAALVSVQLSWTGYSLVRRSVGGLMDAEDRGLLQKIGEIFSKHAHSGIIRVHHTRIIRSGGYHHIDCHLVVPEFWSVEKAHDETGIFEAEVMKDYGSSGELHAHLDPCRRRYCEYCDLKECPVRQVAFQKKIPFSIDELVSPYEKPLTSLMPQQ